MCVDPIHFGVLSCYKTSGLLVQAHDGNSQAFEEWYEICLFSNMETEVCFDQQAAVGFD